MFSNRDDQRFIIGVLVAFLPAMVIGALAYSTIKSVLFNVWIVCTMLVAGGLVLLWIDRLKLKPRYHDATKFTLPMYLGIGVMQCLSMVPGVSRAGATIVGAMLFGADKRAATEFSFWLAMPTMVGAFAFEAYKNRGEFTGGNTLIIAVGFAVSFICGWFVVKTLLGYVSRHGFALFAWWRIVVGALGLLALFIGL
jgi:undecaprenyl-diphosphatase